MRAKALASGHDGERASRRALAVGAALALLAMATGDRAAAQDEARTSAGRVAPAGALEPRPQPRECRLAGWTLFVVTDGECMNLPETKELAHYADARPGEFDAGFGWRGRRTSLVVGYTDPQDGYIWQDQNPATVNLVRPGDSGLFGVSAVVRLR